MTHRQLTLTLTGQPAAVLTLPASLSAEHLLDLGFGDTAGKGDGQGAARVGKAADRCGIDAHG